MSRAPIRVLCIDDNRLLAEALERRLSLADGLEWAGWVEHASDATRVVRERRPDVALMDIDMPGTDSFSLVRAFGAVSPETRALMFSGHVRREYVDRAVDAGAWGYLSKSDSLEGVIAAIRSVSLGEFVLSPEVRLDGAGEA